MESNKIMEMKADANAYSRKALIAAAVGVCLLVMGVPVLFACFKYNYSDEMSALIFGVALCWIGIDALQIALGNYKKFKKAQNTYLVLKMDEIKGKINGKDFEIKTEDLVSASVQVCSVDCDFFGVPKTMNPGFFLKLYSLTNKYLCLFTNTGKTYYIDCLTSPETAKNTIDAIIAKNMASRKETV